MDWGQLQMPGQDVRSSSVLFGSHAQARHGLIIPGIGTFRVCHAESHITNPYFGGTACPSSAGLPFVPDCLASFCRLPPQIAKASQQEVLHWRGTTLTTPGLVLKAVFRPQFVLFCFGRWCCSEKSNHGNA